MSPERAAIPVDDRGFLYGDALFETMPFYGGVPFRWNAHLARMEQGLKLLRIALPYPAAKLKGFASELVKLNAMPDCVLRLTVSRGSAPRGYSIKLAQKTARGHDPASVAERTRGGLAADHVLVSGAG